MIGKRSGKSFREQEQHESGGGEREFGLWSSRVEAKWWSRTTNVSGKTVTGQTSQCRVFIFKAMGSRGIKFIIAPNWCPSTLKSTTDF